MYMKCRIIVIAIISIIGAIWAPSTFSYFTTQESATNVITSGNIEMELIDVLAEEVTFSEDGILMLPGDSIKKTVSAKNTGEHPFFLRVKIIKSVNDENLEVDNCILLNINDENWTYKEGFYYYNSALAPGETAKALFTEVYMNGKQVDNDYLGKYFTVDVCAYAVQSEYNGESVWEAKFWPEK